MTLLEIIATLLLLSALFGHLNHNYLKLPHTIGLMTMGISASLVIVAVEWLWPRMHIGETVRPLLVSIDFRAVLLDGFLSALLFAGAVHVDLAEITQRKWTIGILATVGVLISTFVVGLLIWLLGSLLGANIPFIWALVFGALISPTDPVAVVSLMKTVRVPASLHATISGESLLNDGVGVVLFTIVVALAAPAGHGEAMGVYDAIRLFVVEAVGGATLGLLTGTIAYSLLRTLDEHNIEVMITLALVAVTYAIALRLHISGPIAVVIAGVLIGNQGARFAMSDNTREHVFQFWDLIDELLNSVLFLLIGLEVLVIGWRPDQFGLALLAIPVVLIARFLSVAIPMSLLSRVSSFSKGVVAILTWGGLRGGISVALALSLPETPYKGQMLAATYLVVIFTILVQGLTMRRLVQAYYPETL